MFQRVLIANRGEIAVRVARTCRDLGVSVATVFSDADRGSLHTEVADEAIHLPGVAPVDTYLNVEALVDAARRTGSEAVHPGYGFLSERSEFAGAVVDAGLTWVGPPPDVLDAVGDKIAARRIATGANVPVVPGMLEPVDELDQVKEFADANGFPIAIKAAAGGGGRGLKIARRPQELDAAFDSARREAEAYFGDRAVYVERYLENPKHLEVQILAPNPDEALWLGVRDCSLQRRHQKLIEETPPPRHVEIVAAMGDAAVSLSKACGYVNAGTVEFLVDDGGAFYFLEINARLQVEHTITEEVTGIDLVACQLRIASGEGLGFSQQDVDGRGHSIECRINAEDPARGFLPTPGRIARLAEPSGPGVRVDGGYRSGDEVPAAYDSLLAKVITVGSDRPEAITRMQRALGEMVVEGLATTIPAHQLLLADPAFVAGTHTTRTIEEGTALAALEPIEPAGDEHDVLLVGGHAVRLWNPAMSASAAAAVHGGGGAPELVAPMQGTILKVLVEPQQEVEPGDAVFVLEAMKMETVIAAPRGGKVADIRVSVGDAAAPGQVLATIE